jgi:dienelactone hydrolase
VFYFPHWFALAALIAITIGFICIRLRRPKAYWLNAHLTCMVASYYLLIGGGVNEVFLRVGVLHAMAPDVLNSHLVGMTHFAVMAAFAILLAYFNISYRRSRALMHLCLVATIAATVLGAGMRQGQAGESGPDQVTFQSASYADFRQLLSRAAPNATVTVPATLSFPGEARDRYPAVVIVHSLAGYIDGNEGQYAAELRKAGFATLTYDGFAARGTTGIALASSGPGLWPNGVADAYAALKLLASDPRIDAQRIAIVGFSYGGEVAHLTAMDRLRAAVDQGSARFAAHVAYYPAGVFGAIAESGAYTGSPILMLLGEKDDNLPVVKVEGYLDYAKAAASPAPIEAKIYPGAYHAWTVPRLTTLRFYGEYPSSKQCPFILLGSGRPALLVDGQPAPFDPTGFGACMAKAPGYSMIYDAQVSAKSAADSIEFLRQRLVRP